MRQYVVIEHTLHEQAPTGPTVAGITDLEKLFTVLPRDTAMRVFVSATDALPVLDGLPTTGSVESLNWGTISRRPTANGNIAVILTVYKRCHMLDQQITSIKSSLMSSSAWDFLAREGYPVPATRRNYTVTQIFVVRNGNHCDPAPALAGHPDVHVIASLTWNTAFFGRYLPSLMLDEQFSLVLDDDLILEKYALLNLMRAMALHGEHAVVGAGGKRIVIKRGADPTLPDDKDIQAQNVECSCHDPRTRDSLVDYVTNAYLFPTVFARVLFGPGAWTQTLENSDDMTMGMIARRYLGAPSVCALHHPEACVVNYGADSVATSSSSTHWLVRRSTLAYWYSRGYRGVCPYGGADSGQTPSDANAADVESRCLPVETPHLVASTA